jgi:hypothetical protein
LSGNPSESKASLTMRFAMTFREIIEREDHNRDCIWMYREGMFMKAYERSTFFAHTLIYEFKLSKPYIKTVNMDVISLHIFPRT